MKKFSLRKGLLTMAVAFATAVTAFSGGTAKAVDGPQEIKNGDTISHDFGKEEETVSYTFSLEKDAVVTLKNGKFVSKDGGGICYLLYNSKGEPTTDVWGSGSQTEVDKTKGFAVISEATYYLPKGDYYLDFTNSAFLMSLEEGSLSIDFIYEYAKSSETENGGGADNDSLLNAQKIDVNETYQGTLFWDDLLDTYKFEIENEGVISFHVKQDGNVGTSLIIYDADGNNLREVWSGNKEEVFDKTSVAVKPGTYYFQIKANGGRYDLGMSYQFEITPPSPNEFAGEVFAEYDGYEFRVDEAGDIRCFNLNGNRMVINDFKCDGTYTYFFQADGTAMKDRLTYHPDGVHVIYFDKDGHEVFSDFANVKKTIAGDAVDDYCFFNVFGYMYVDVVTYDKTGTKLYYANAYGVLERGRWFQFSENAIWADGRAGDEFKGGYGYANEDGTLKVNERVKDFNGNYCYLQGNGVAAY